MFADLKHPDYSETVGGELRLKSQKELANDMCKCNEAVERSSSKYKVKVRAKASKKSKEIKRAELAFNSASLRSRCSPHIDVQARQTRFAEGLTTVLQGIDIRDLTVIVDGRCLLNMTRLELGPGRYGFIGPNGSGKTTLMRLIADHKLPGFPRVSTVLVEQEDVGDGNNPVDAILYACEDYRYFKQEESILQRGLECHELAIAAAEVQLGRARRARAALESNTDHLSGRRGGKATEDVLRAEKHERAAEEAFARAKESVTEESYEATARLMDEIQEGLAILDEVGLTIKARTILMGLGFTENMLHSSTDSLSGGWRMRVGLAKALLLEPEVLLLDEPTNHLDWAAILWLEEYLQTLENMIVVIVSHDRTFLDNVATKILRVHNMQLSVFEGNYSEWERGREETQKFNMAAYAQLQKQGDQLQDQVARMEREGRRTQNTNLLSQAASRRKKLQLAANSYYSSHNAELLDHRDYEIYTGGFMRSMAGTGVKCAEALVEIEDDVSMKLKSAGPLGYHGAVLQLKELAVAHPEGPMLVKPFDMDIDVNSRIALLGLNACGKSTLLRTIARAIAPRGGEVYQHQRLVVAHLSQHQTDALPFEKSPLTILRQLGGQAEMSEMQARGHLAAFGIKGKKALQPIGSMSGGEKIRVGLAGITVKPPHVLLLDEPTNHLDLLTVAALSKALRAFEGGIVLVSHDRWLIESVCDEFYTIREGQLKRCDSLHSFANGVRTA